MPLPSLFRRFLLLALLPLAGACSYSTFDPIYNPYPACARSCLACKDSDYINDFANNCNYTKGECCQTKYHTSIAETWHCVRSNCGVEPSKDAFSTFVKYCKEVGSVLASEDFPQGYEASTTTADEPDPGPKQLSKGEIAGIVIGVVSAIATLIGAAVAVRHYKKRIRDLESQPGQLGPPLANPSAIAVAQRIALQSHDRGTVLYKKRTWKVGLSGLSSTSELVEMKKEPTQNGLGVRMAGALPLPRRTPEEEEID